MSVDSAHRHASPVGEHFHLPHAEQILVDSHPLIIIGVTVPATVPLPPHLPIIEREHGLARPSGKTTLNLGLKRLTDRRLGWRFRDFLLRCLNLNGYAALNFRLALCRIGFASLALLPGPLPSPRR